MTDKLKAKILLASRSASLNADGRKALDAVAGASRDLKGKNVIVAGYTDDVRVSKPMPLTTGTSPPRAPSPCSAASSRRACRRRCWAPRATPSTGRSCRTTRRRTGRSTAGARSRTPPPRSRRSSARRDGRAGGKTRRASLARRAPPPSWRGLRNRRSQALPLEVPLALGRRRRDLPADGARVKPGRLSKGERAAPCQTGSAT